jgi:methylmalonic aciduria homocystinuria type C protein
MAFQRTRGHGQAKKEGEARDEEFLPAGGSAQEGRIEKQRRFSRVNSKAEDLLKGFQRACVAAGIDLVEGFPVALYNPNVPEAYQLPTFGRASPFGIVLGNSRAFWPRFLGALKESQELREAEHPVNAYVTETVARLLQDLPLACEVRWAHTSEPSPVAMQRAAMIAGLAHTSPSYLSIHPEHGPWIALRAVIVPDEDWTSGEPAPAPDPCSPCPKPCLAALDRAVAASRHEPMGKKVSSNWKLWLAVRDACPMGRSSRYSDEQCEYHYRPDRTFLLSLFG